MKWPIFTIAPSCITCKTLLTRSEGKAGSPAHWRNSAGTLQPPLQLLFLDKRAGLVVPLPQVRFYQPATLSLPLKANLLSGGSRSIGFKKAFSCCVYVRLLFKKAVRCWHFGRRRREAAPRSTSWGPPLDFGKETWTPATASPASTYVTEEEAASPRGKEGPEKSRQHPLFLLLKIPFTFVRWLSRPWRSPWWWNQHPRSCPQQVTAELKSSQWGPRTWLYSLKNRASMVIFHFRLIQIDFESWLSYCAELHNRWGYLVNVKRRSLIKYSLSTSSDCWWCRAWMHAGGLTLKVTVPPCELLPLIFSWQHLCTGDSKELSRVLRAGRLNASCSEGKTRSRSPSELGKQGWNFPSGGRQQIDLIKNSFFIIQKLDAAIPTMRDCCHRKRWQQSLTDGNAWTEPRTNQDEFGF